MANLSDILNRGVPGVDIEALLEQKAMQAQQQQAAMPPPARRQAPVKMPPLPAAARGAAKRARKNPISFRPDDILGSLMSKAIPAVDDEGVPRAPGPGMIPYGELPKKLRDFADKVYGQDMLGFDPRDLNAQEMELLARLLKARKQSVPSPEQQARVERMMLAQARRGM